MLRRLLVVALAVAVAGLPALSTATDPDSLAIGSDESALPIRDAEPNSRLEPVQGIGPGSQLSIDRPDGSYSCTANFVFEAPDGDRYLGTAGHCIVPDHQMGTHGPRANFDASRVRVQVAGGCPVEVYADSCTVADGPTWWELGDVAYARDGITSDFAVIEIPERLHELVRPVMPEWGGPDGMAAAGEGDPGRRVLYYGHGEGPGRVVGGRARAGVLADTAPNSTLWSAAAEVAWGDSGAPVVLASDEEPPGLGGPALGFVTSIGAPGAVGYRFHNELADVLCWAGLDLRVVPNGTFVGECPRPAVGTEGAHGTLLAVDASRDASYDTRPADIERVWLDSDGSHARVTFRIADLREDQRRTRYQVHGILPDTLAPDWSIYCYSGGRGGVLSEPLQCNGYPASWDIDRDLIWAEIPYSEFGWESGDTVGEVFGKAKQDHPVWGSYDSFSGNGTHTLS